MRRKSLRRRKNTVSPFGLYSMMWNTGMQAMEMACSSAEVIARRTQLMQKSLLGIVPLDDKEYTRMWQEKAQAGGEAWLASMQQAGKWMFNPPTSAQGYAQEQLKAMTGAMQPYRRKAKANAKRLRTKK